ncbi:DUF1015 domain-containing protein [Hominifimenecus sp. rT4P-3]|uniref:DUF1015 domain-containing protein n=1 Tax=Hominifimenecus sp. rT4P-3 TaxID=3242979 RepID=UPI003DA61906
MAVFRPFAALRPEKEVAAKVAALPYDVMNSEEARQMAAGNPYSFLHVDKAEIDLEPSVNLYSDAVYEKAASNLKQMIEDGVYLKEEANCYYIYRQIMGARSQAGIVGCASIDDYLENRIKKHELTRAEKEEDRIRHVDTCNANTGPIFLTYRSSKELSHLTREWMANHQPEYDFTAEDGVRHTVWVISCEETVKELERAFQEIPDFYIADGHHRAASAVKVGLRRREQKPDFDGTEEFNYFLAVAFPSEELHILDYNRVVCDLNGLSQEAFLEKVQEKFKVFQYLGEHCRPERRHTFGMYLDGMWYLLEARPESFNEKDPVRSLDVSILQENLLTPILGIGDPRKDSRIDFIGGIRGVTELERLVDGGMAVAFSMYPTGMDELMDIADSGNTMPPKSTWFEPKLRSGLFLHELGE